MFIRRMFDEHFDQNEDKAFLIFALVRSFWFDFFLFICYLPQLMVLIYAGGFIYHYLLAPIALTVGAYYLLKKLVPNITRTYKVVDWLYNHTVGLVIFWIIHPIKSVVYTLDFILCVIPYYVIMSPVLIYRRLKAHSTRVIRVK